MVRSAALFKRLRLGFLAMAGVSAALFGQTAAAQDRPPPQAPVLRIEPGMHIAPIKRMGVDRNCTAMVTGSDDKTVRLWSLPDGKLRRVLRMPIGDGDEGKVFSVAMSPDGRLVAAGGWDTNWSIGGSMAIYVFEAQTGQLVKRFGAMRSVINHLTFSPDGRYLAALIGSKEGLRVFSTDNWEQVGEDTDYGNQAYGAAFDRFNWLYTVSYDGFIRQYDAQFRLVTKAKVQGGKQPFSVAVHPQGDRVAVGYIDSPAVNIHDAQGLKHRHQTDTTGLSDDLLAVGWSADGERLYGGGRYYDFGQKKRPVRVWDRQGLGQGKNLGGGLTTIMQFLPCGRNVAMVNTDPGIGLITPSGEFQLWQTSVQVDMRTKLGANLTVAPDGSVVRFGLGYAGDEPVMFDLGFQQLSDAPGRIPALTEPDTTSINVTNWENQVDPKLNGKPIQLRDFERARSLAVTPDKQSFVLGTEWGIRHYTREGKELWHLPVPAIAWGVNITRDGRLLVVAYGDGTLRWHRMTDGKELLALFVHAKDRRWVAWTPGGYYMSSPGGEDLIGWHVNRDWNQAADFFPVGHFRDRFYRPDVVLSMLQTLDEGTAVEQANVTARRKPPEQEEDLTRRLPPVIDILGPVDGSKFKDNVIKLQYQVRSPSGLPIKRVRALIDGREVTTQSRGLTLVKDASADGEIEVQLPSRDVRVSLIAETEAVSSDAATIGLIWDAAQPVTADLAKPSLYALVAGVAPYKDSNITSLKWAGQDARDIAAMLKEQVGGLYRKVEVRLLADQDATRDGIIDGLDWLERAPSQGDVVMVFLAGHGMTDEKNRYYYLPHDAELEADASGVLQPKRSRAVLHSDIQNALRSIPAHALFLFDTCHAGSASGVNMRGGQDLTPFINELSSADNGVVVLSSSTGKQLSQERDEWRNGAFTEALLSGFGGGADFLPKDGVVSIDELELYVKDKVKTLTAGRQHPVAVKPKEARNIPIVALR